MDQINEARDSMLKVLDHKDRVLKLLNKNGTVKKVSKLKRKEKVWTQTNDFGNGERVQNRAEPFCSLGLFLSRASE